MFLEKQERARNRTQTDTRIFSCLFVFLLLVLFFLFTLSSNVQNSSRRKELAAILTVTVVFSEEFHTFDTSFSFSESLVNHNGTSLDTDFPAFVLSSGDEIEMQMLSISESFVVADKLLPTDMLAANTFYDISFTNTDNSSSITSFDKSITLTFHYTDGDIVGIDERTLVVYRWDGSNWVALNDSIVDVAVNTVTATAQQFSYFALLGEESVPLGVGGGGNGGPPWFFAVRPVIVKEEVEEVIPKVVFEKPIAEMTAIEIKAKIAEILEAVSILKTLLNQALAEEAAKIIPSEYMFAKNLSYGQKNDDIKYLQAFLKAQGTEIYPEGLVTGYFGSLTRAAVVRFQEKYIEDILYSWGLTEGTGFVGETTRAKINEILSR